MIKKYLKLFFCAFLCMVFLSGCRNESKGETDQSIYIGDNSKVVHIVDALPYPDGMSYGSVEMQSAEEPYELKVFVLTDRIQSEGLKECADIAFEKISNMGIISFYDKDNDTLIESFSR